MTKLFLRLLLVGVLSFPASLYALGLGEIHLNSALSQPFDAEFELLNPTADELAALKINLASSEIFSRSGVERPQFLSNLRFKVVSMGGGHTIVRVTSVNAIAEPVVTFLVEAVWPHGTLVREYTVLLDPPVFIPNQQADDSQRSPSVPSTDEARTEGVIERSASSSADSGQAAVPPPTAMAQEAASPDSVTTTPVAPPSPSSESEPVRTESSASTPMFSGDSYEVQRNDSLSRIASRLRPGTRREVHQTMMALYRANPRAFAGNINRLKAGAVMRVPTTEEVDGVDAREAGSEIARQYEEWRNRGTATASESEGSGSLRLVAPTEPAGPSKAELAAQEKAAKQAAADAAKQEAAERSAADAKLKADAEAKRLADLKSAEMARIQNEREQKESAAKAAAEKAAAEEQAKAAAALAAQSAGQSSAQSSSAAMSEPEAAPEQVQPEPAAAEPAQAEQVKPAPAPVEPTPWWKENLSVILGVVGILALVGFWIWNRSRQKTHHIDMPVFSSPSSDFGVPTMTPADFGDALMEDDLPVRPTEPRISRSHIPNSIPEAEGTKPLFGSSPPPETRASRLDDTMSSETAIHLDQPDALAEADFHMAYGLYDQAADLVAIALQREPNRRDLKLKLLEIYFVWGNKDLFVETARDLHNTRDQAPGGEWDKIVIMGKQIAPENSLFSGSTSSGDVLDVNLEGGENRVDFDLFSAPESSVNEPAATLDFEVGNTGERAKPGKLDFLLEDSGSAPRYTDDDTREMDSNARTQETPTIEMPMIDPTEGNSPTARERTLRLGSAAQSVNREIPATDRTAELSLDDLGLDVGSLEQTGLLHDAEHTSLLGPIGGAGDGIGDAEMTQIAPMQMRQSLESTREMPKIKMPSADEVSVSLDARSGNTIDSDHDEGIDTIYLEQMQSIGGELVDTMGLGTTSGETAHMLSPAELDLDLARLADELDVADKSAAARRNTGTHSSNTGTSTRTEVLGNLDDATGIEPVTMSEVGTKLDLARAYMDMGDPDGARSILEEVLQEGNSGQRSEAQRLLDSIR